MSTVSAVLSGRQEERRISAALVSRVQASARRLGYVPNIAARQMRTGLPGKRHLVLAILTSYEAPLEWVAWVVRGAEEEGRSSEHAGLSFSVTVEFFHVGRLCDCQAIRHSDQCHGVIIANTVSADDEFLAAHPLPFPAVLVNRTIDGYSAVTIDGRDAGARAARILMEVGRQRLAVLHPLPVTQATFARLDGFATEIRRLTGAPPIEIPVEELSEAGAFRAVSGYYAAGGNADGIFTLGDTYALGTYHAIARSGRSIPDDVAVIGYDGLSFAPFLDPPLSTFETRRPSLQRAAVRILLNLLLGDREEVHRETFYPDCVLRASTGH